MTKYFFWVSLIGLVAFFFWPVGPESGIYKYRKAVINSATSTGKSSEECKQELELKRAQVVAYEEAIVKADEAFERMAAEIPVCPRTGQRSPLTIKDDPRPELRTKVETLKEEIKVLEGKVSGS
jgi:chaperonin cofactor prefoldin